MSGGAAFKVAPLDKFGVLTKITFQTRRNDVRREVRASLIERDIMVFCRGLFGEFLFAIKTLPFVKFTPEMPLGDGMLSSSASLSGPSPCVVYGSKFRVFLSPIVRSLAFLFSVFGVVSGISSRRFFRVLFSPFPVTLHGVRDYFLRVLLGPFSVIGVALFLVGVAILFAVGQNFLLVLLVASLAGLGVVLSGLLSLTILGSNGIKISETSKSLLFVDRILVGGIPAIRRVAGFLSVLFNPFVGVGFSGFGVLGAPRPHVFGNFLFVLLTPEALVLSSGHRSIIS